MRRRIISATLWGAVGGMSFLVLLQAYALLAGPLLPFAQGAIVAFGVGVVAAVTSYALEQRVADWAARRALEGEDTAESGNG